MALHENVSRSSEVRTEVHSFLKELLPLLETNFSLEISTSVNARVPPTMGIIYFMLCQFKRVYKAYRSSDGSREQFFLNMVVELFDLNPPPGHYLISVTTLPARIKDLEARKTRAGGKWKTIQHLLFPEMFFTSPSKPQHLSIPVGETEEIMRAILQQRTGNGVDVYSVKLYATEKYLETPKDELNDTFGVIPQHSVEIKDENFAIFYLHPKTGWQLDFLLLRGKPYAMEFDALTVENKENGGGKVGSKGERHWKKEMENEQVMGRGRTRDAVGHAYESNVVAQTCIANLPGRVGPDKEKPQMMVAFGIRSSQQRNSYGEQAGLHCKGNEILVGREAVGSGVIAAVVKYFIKPLFGGTLLNLIEECADYGGRIYPSTPPFTVGSVTKNYSNTSHCDSGDLVGGFIVWLHAGVGTMEGGAFVCSSHGCHIVPKDGHVLYLGTPEVYHHSTPPTATGTRCLLGVGLAAKKNVITNLKNQLIAVLTGKKAGELLTSEEDIPAELLTPEIQELFEILNTRPKNKKIKT